MRVDPSFAKRGDSAYRPLSASSSRRAKLSALAAAIGFLAVSVAEAQTPIDYYHALATGGGGLSVIDELHVRPGGRNLRARLYENAYSEAKFILNLVPNHPQGLILLVQTCEQWKSPKCKVEDYLEKAIAINPKAAGTYTTQGIYLHRSRRYTDAIASFTQALELDPSSVNAQYNIGLAYLETKQYELANQHAQRAYALGAPFPALRTKLQKAGYWKPIPAPEAPAAGSSPAQPAERQDEDAKK
jgi:tetratricopeptide (TPR) repeat protein